MTSMRVMRASYLSRVIFGAWRGYRSKHKTRSGRAPAAEPPGTGPPPPHQHQQHQKVDNKATIGSSDYLITLIGLVEATSLAYLVFNYFLSSSIMVGASMMPTFRPRGDIVLVDRISHRRNLLQPGENPYGHVASVSVSTSP